MGNKNQSDPLVTVFCVMAAFFLAIAMNLVVTELVTGRLSLAWFAVALAYGAVSGSAFYLSLWLEHTDNDTFGRNVWLGLVVGVLLMVLANDLA
ncbi:MAG: hypothetical protein MUF19_01555 [Candidatus Pacebacteria bacterium]|jgi:hypothetical protein|nr:hypothetical protein [Candidatus Paceibacterota bacterium]